MYKYKAKCNKSFRAGGKRYTVLKGDMFETSVELSEGYKDWAEEVRSEVKLKVKGDK